MITWNSSIATGNKEIDNQHKQLVETLNLLYDAMRHEHGNDQIAPILMKLKDYTIYHFNSEQNLFSKSNYPETEDHIKTHKEFTDTLIKWEKEFKEGKFLLSIEILEFLTNWLLNHIQKTDKQMVKYLL